MYQCKENGKSYLNKKKKKNQCFCLTPQPKNVVILILFPALTQK